MTYRVSPFQKGDTPDDIKVPAAAPNVENTELLNRLATLEAKLNQLTTPNGGKFDGLL